MKNDENQNLESVLESAVIVNWTDVMHSARGGVHFHNGYQSAELSRLLPIVMQHQKEFALPKDLGRQGLLHIATLTEDSRKAAVASMSSAANHLNSGLGDILLARC